MARDAGEADDNGSMTNGQAVVAVLVRHLLHAPSHASQTDLKVWALVWALTAARVNPQLARRADARAGFWVSPSTLVRS